MDKEAPDFICDDYMNGLLFLTEHGRTPTYLELDRFIRALGYILVDPDAELPKLKKPRMKLTKLKEVIDKTVEHAENTDPDVIFYVGGGEYELDNIGQFSVIPDVTIHIHDFKAGWVKPKERK